MEIRKNVPMPRNQREAGELLSALRIMEVGDSIVVSTSHQHNSKKIRKIGGKKFAQRRLDDGTIGIWRTV